MIKVKNLDFSYRAKRHIFRDLSLSVDAGQICGLLGSNGIGKSTLLKLIGGLLTPNSGSVEVQGSEAQRHSLATLQNIAYLPEEFSLPNIRVKDWVAVTAPFYGSFDHAFFAKAMGEFEVNEGEKFGSLSMGQRKKVLIAFAMACGTSLLLLDEPTNGLDITSKQTFRRLLAEWATPSRTAIISTHQVKDVENLLDHIIILDKLGNQSGRNHLTSICHRIIECQNLDRSKLDSISVTQLYQCCMAIPYRGAGVRKARFLLIHIGQ